MATPTVTDAPFEPRLDAPPGLTVSELADRVGDVPLGRIRMTPAPGTATEADITAAERAGLLCELIDGVLVEKAVRAKASRVGAKLIISLGGFVEEKRLGFVLAADGFVRLPGHPTWRSPDVGYFRADEAILETAAYPEIAPTLAVEVLSPGNTPGEMKKKVDEFFASGTERVWIIDPKFRTAVVYRSTGERIDIAADGMLEGGETLPGFSIKLSDLFPGSVDPQTSK